ncbi:MAG: twin-arginine translocation signal domain-containing protein [Gemmataceae bacterium]|nr:twin-arginine translocation signal domain-containing protein [Gemmataceae bacterium]
MLNQNNRRQFLQASVAAGAGLTVGVVSSNGNNQATSARFADGNPSVTPGRVRWHDDFAAACKAQTEDPS